MTQRDGSALRVLVVDDDGGIVAFLSGALADGGHGVVAAPNGQAALELIEARHPDIPPVILLDVNIPVMDGPAFTRAYRESPVPHAPILCVTAAHDARRRCHEVGAADVIVTPFEVGERLASVERLAARAA